MNNINEQGIPNEREATPISDSLFASLSLPSWLNSWSPNFSEMPSSPNGRPHSGVAAAKRLARKQRNQRRARLARHA